MRGFLHSFAAHHSATLVVQTIESKNSAALTEASAGTSGSGQFSAVASRLELSKDATEKVAQAVNNMVVEVLHKDYTVDSCMTLMTNPGAFSNLNQTQIGVLENTLDQCRKLMEAKIQKEISALQVGTYGKDTSSERLLKDIKADAAFSDRLQQWVERNYSGSMTLFLYSEEAAQFRLRAIQQLNAP